MVEYTKEKNYVHNDCIIVKNEEMKFEISLEENDCIYIGFCVPNENVLDDNISFNITKENEKLFSAINKLMDEYKELVSLMGNKITIKSLKNKDKLLSETKNDLLSNRAYNHIRNEIVEKSETISWYSDDFCLRRASKLEITQNDDESYTFTFTRSKSKGKINTYFVCISKSSSRYQELNLAFINFYNRLLEKNIERKEEYTRVHKL